MSTPPVTHISSIPSTVRSGGDQVIAPGAESVGQARIVSELSRPFVLDGLFGDADDRAFDTEAKNTEDSEMETDHAPVGEGTFNQDT